MLPPAFSIANSLATRFATVYAVVLGKLSEYGVMTLREVT